MNVCAPFLLSIQRVSFYAFKNKIEYLDFIGNEQYY